MEKNIAYSKLLRKANLLFDDANNKLSELIILNKKIKQDDIQKDYHEQILSINANVPTEDLTSYLHYQKSILENQVKFNNKLKELSSIINIVLLYCLQIMNLSIEDSEIDLNTKSQSKDILYKTISFIENHKLNAIIDFNSILPIIVELDIKVAEADNINKRNIQNRITKLKRIIFEQK